MLHLGFRDLHIVAAKSKIARFNSLLFPCGIKSWANFHILSSLRALAFEDFMSKTLSIILIKFVSTIGTSTAYEKLKTALAVYNPIPGSCRRSFELDGMLPLNFSRIAFLKVPIFFLIHFRLLWTALLK